jgi:hypothetical protein
MKQLGRNVLYSPVRICLLGSNDKPDPTQPTSGQRPTRIVVFDATADFTDAPDSYWDYLHVNSLGFLPIINGDSILVGNCRHTGKILLVGLWQRV